MKKWAAEFKRGRESLEDEPKSGLPQPPLKKYIDYINQMEMDDRRLTVNHIANVMSISHEHVSISRGTWHVKVFGLMGSSF